MKKLLVTALTLAGLSASVFGQGTILFQDVTIPHKVYVGSSPASGTFTVELLGGAAGLTEAQLSTTPLVVFTSTTGSGIFYDGTAITIPGAPAGTGTGDTVNNATLDIIGWTGNYTSLAAAQAAGALIGDTGAFQNHTGGGGTPAAAPSNFTGWVGNLVLVPVPEPTTLALGGLGAAALFLFRRRKN